MRALYYYLIKNHIQHASEYKSLLYKSLTINFPWSFITRVVNVIILLIFLFLPKLF